jgi:hypothetical protein
MLKHELQNFITGNGSVRHGTAIQAIKTYLGGEKSAIPQAERESYSKKEEEKLLRRFIDSNNLWINSLNKQLYIGEGAEQKIYESDHPGFILKVNDGIFYSFWEDYLNSLLIHNYFFEHLAYELIGFTKKDSQLFAVVKQPFVESNEPTNLLHVKEFLLTNGFVNTRNNDYYLPDVVLILEDLHDENVLTRNGVLQFIDTVFYLTPDFYK